MFFPSRILLFLDHAVAPRAQETAGYFFLFISFCQKGPGVLSIRSLYGPQTIVPQYCLKLLGPTIETSLASSLMSNLSCDSPSYLIR